MLAVALMTIGVLFYRRGTTENILHIFLKNQQEIRHIMRSGVFLLMA